MKARRARRRAQSEPPTVPVAPRAAAAVAVLAVSAAVPLFANDAIGYAPLLIVAFLAAVSFIYLKLIVRRISFTQRASHYEWLRGEEGSATVTLINDSPLPAVRVLATFVVMDDEALDPSYITTSCAPGPRSREEIGIDLVFDHVGSHEVGLVRMQIFDLLGLFSHTVRCDGRVQLRIVPRIYDLERMRLSENLSSDAKRAAKSVLSDDVDYAYVREYEMGDPMKKVHWKLSARSGGKLFTKLFETHNNPGITVFLDFRSEEEDPERLLDMFDTMLEGAFTLATQARKNGIDATLVFRDANGLLHSSRECSPEELDGMIGDMPRLSARPNAEDAAMMLREVSANPNSESDFYLFTSDLSPSNADALTRLKRDKRGAVAVAVIPPHLSDEERGRRLRPLNSLTEMQVPCVWIDAGKDVWKAGTR